MHHARQWIGFMSVALSAAPVLAHPGHGVTPAGSPWHYAVEPVHAVWTLVALAIVGGGYLVRRQLRLSRQQAIAPRRKQSDTRG